VADRFLARTIELSTPGRNVFAITPNDATEIDPLPRSVRFNVGGTVAFRTVDGIADVTATVASGEQLDYRIRYIRATGTTATGILGAE
jgi:hypothetical protein